MLLNVSNNNNCATQAIALNKYKDRWERLKESAKRKKDVKNARSSEEPILRDISGDQLTK